jgi:hypothetical protein
MTFVHSARIESRNALDMWITVTDLQHATHINYTKRVSFKKTIMNDLSVCKFLAQWGLHVNLNESRVIDAFLIKSYPAVVQVSPVLSIIKTDFKCMPDKDDLYADFTYIVLGNAFS